MSRFWFLFIDFSLNSSYCYHGSRNQAHSKINFCLTIITWTNWCLIKMAPARAPWCICFLISTVLLSICQSFFLRSTKERKSCHIEMHLFFLFLCLKTKLNSLVGTCIVNKNFSENSVILKWICAVLTGIEMCFWLKNWWSNQKFWCKMNLYYEIEN